MDEAVSDSAPAAPSTLAAWWRQGLRAALLQRADTRALVASPGRVALLVLAAHAAGLVVERLYIAGPAVFHAPALLGGWGLTAVVAWVCWALVPRPHAAVLFALIAALSLPVTAGFCLVFLPLVRAGVFDDAAPAVTWAAWLFAVAWPAAAMLRALWPHLQPPSRRALASVLLVAVMALHQYWPNRHWFAPPPPAPEVPALSQETMEWQSVLLRRRLEALAEGRPGVIDLYAVTFAPYAGEDVFRRESAMVQQVMDERFDAAGRSLQLVNNAATQREHPWATPANLRRAIRQVAQRMNRDEDVLFIHLTSHGAKDGLLAAAMPPMEMPAVTPQQLALWLDEAGIRYRVISISACYSGSWIAPLRGPGTLVVTAADATHTSFGCGRGSPLTFFGRAMYDEQLRGATRDFEQAHAAARRVIADREQAAGKNDGYSNPQISMGADVRPVLRALADELARPR